MPSEVSVYVDPPFVDNGDGEDPPGVDVSTRIQYPSGMAYHCLATLPADAPPALIAEAVLNTARGAATAYSPLVATLLADRIDAAAQPRPGGLTVATVDAIAEQSGAVMLEVPGAGRIPVHVVRAILVAAGAW